MGKRVESASSSYWLAVAPGKSRGDRFLRWDGETPKTKSNALFATAYDTLEECERAIDLADLAENKKHIVACRFTPKRYKFTISAEEEGIYHRTVKSPVGRVSR